jgi:hypothetical protein
MVWILWKAHLSRAWSPADGCAYIYILTHSSCKCVYTHILTYAHKQALQFHVVLRGTCPSPLCLSSHSLELFCTTHKHTSFSGGHQVGFTKMIIIICFSAYTSISNLLMKEEIIISLEPGWPASGYRHHCTHLEPREITFMFTASTPGYFLCSSGVHPFLSFVLGTQPPCLWPHWCNPLWLQRSGCGQFAFSGTLYLSSFPTARIHIPGAEHCSLTSQNFPTSLSTTPSTCSEHQFLDCLPVTLWEGKGPRRTRLGEWVMFCYGHGHTMQMAWPCQEMVVTLLVSTMTTIPRGSVSPEQKPWVKCRVARNSSQSLQNIFWSGA